MNAFANGLPTKEFFVEMLTRDIEINDAILDLLDNCLDGVVRSLPDLDSGKDENIYNSFGAEITITNNSFSIKDNCGGIPREVAEEYAFRMGRGPSTNTGKSTIGIYGIGMKRAIFKIGKAAIVHTKNKDTKYSVVIPKDWVSKEKWDFAIKDNLAENDLVENGTEITITSLNEGISELWKNQGNLSAFVENLKCAIQQSYSLIIQKGFSIKINGIAVESNPVELLVQRDNEQGIRPYVFKNSYDDVNVRIAIGFYSPMASDEDIDDMNTLKRSSYEAGITVVCNDRVVLYNDKSSLTGWGTAGVPNYHTQFVGIKGIVIFESSNPAALPMTTTKRGIDHSSAVYIAVKDRICEGLLMFTSYTNQWKGRNKQEREYSTKAEKTSYDKLFSDTAKSEYGVSLRHDAKGETYRPILPKPQNEKPYRIIRYSKDVEQIDTMSQYLYGDVNAGKTPSEIGEKCFDLLYQKTKEGG